MSINGGTAGLGEISTQPVPPQPRRRRLAAVLALDAVGYSQRMESDEERVYRALLDCRSIMRSSIEKHGGRVAGTPGDFLLALFESGADAVSAALDLQSAIAARNQGLDPEDCLVFRAGIGLGRTDSEAAIIVYVNKNAGNRPILPDDIEGVPVMVILTDEFIAR